MVWNKLHLFSGVDRPHEILLHEEALGPRLYLFAKTRFAAALGVLAGALAGKYVVGIAGLPLGALTLLAGAIALYNMPLFAMARRSAHGRVADGSLSRKRQAGWAILLDFAALTVLVALLGGSGSPFFAFYIFHAILVSLLLSRRSAFLVCCIAVAMYSALLIAELNGWVAIRYPAGMVFNGHGIEARYAVAVWFCQAALVVLTVVLVTGVSTVLRRGEHELRSLNDQLDRLSRQRREFMDLAFHDLKASAAAVLSHLDNLQNGLMGPLTAKQAEILGRCERRLEGQLEFLYDLLALAHLETPNLREFMKPEDVGALGAAAADEARDLAEAMGHSLQVEIEPHLPPVMGIDRLLRQAVMNYLTNAIKYTPSGGTISLRMAPLAGGVRVEVRDNGPGIPPDQQPKIFAQFSRGRAAGAGPGLKIASTGLGLSVVKQIVEAHGGRVGFESRPGEGSLFWLELPGCQPEAAASPAARA